MNKSHLLKYLLISPNLPVGGFCYSEGMESFFESKKIKDPKYVKDLIISELKTGQIRFDAKILLEFFDIFKKLQNDNKDNIFIRKLKSLDKWILSSKDSLEIREQHFQMSKSLFELMKEFGFEYLYEKNKYSSCTMIE